MSLLYPGRIDRLEIGLTALNNVDITNVILMSWERNHDVRPRLYANLKYPTTYQQPHSWVLGSFSLLSDNHVALYETDVDGTTAGSQYALVPNDDSNVIDFFRVVYKDEDGNERITRFYYPIIYRWNKELLNYDDSVWVYHFLAGYAVDSEPEMALITTDTVTPDVIWVHTGLSCEVSTSCVLTAGIAAKGAVLTPEGNLAVIDRVNSHILILQGISCATSSYCTPAGSVGTTWGIAIDNDGNFLTTNTTNDSIYVYVGQTCTLSTSFSSPNGYPAGIVVDNDGNLISVDTNSQSIYFHDGITSTILTSCSTPSTNPNGITIDGSGNLITTDSASDSIYFHVGLSCSVSTSCSHGTNPQGITVYPV